MAYTELNRDSSTVPGPTNAPWHRYAYHPSGQAYLMVWRPESGSFQNKPCLVWFSGGLWHNPGYRATSLTAGSVTEQLALDLINTYDWPIVSIHLPQGPSNLAAVRDIPPVSMWPEAEQYAGWAVSYLKDNWSAVAGTTLTQFGESIWGDGNSIDPDKIVTLGTSAGTTTTLCNAFTPDEWRPQWGSVLAQSNDRLIPRSSGRPAAAVGGAGQMDWTQFYFDPSDQGPGRVYGDRRHQHFMRRNSSRTWPSLDMRYKAAASPIILLQEGFDPNKTMPVWLRWSGGTNTGNGGNLTFADWELYSVRDDIDGGKAFTDPHHSFQGRPMATALGAYGDARSAVYWGNDTGGDTNENTGYSGVDKGPAEVSGGFSLADGATYSLTVRTWLTSLGITAT